MRIDYQRPYFLPGVRYLSEISDDLSNIHHINHKNGTSRDDCKDESNFFLSRLGKGSMRLQTAESYTCEIHSGCKVGSCCSAPITGAAHYCMRFLRKFYIFCDHGQTLGILLKVSIPNVWRNCFQFLPSSRCMVTLELLLRWKS